MLVKLAEDIIQLRNDIYYRNVYLFVQKIKDIAITKGNAIIRTNLNTYFKGIVLI